MCSYVIALIQVYCQCVCVCMINLEAVVETLGLRLDLLGILQHPLVQHQRLTPLLHQHIGLGYEEAPVSETRGTRRCINSLCEPTVHYNPVDRV